jgi:hypothetical protein
MYMWRSEGLMQRLHAALIRMELVLGGVIFHTTFWAILRTDQKVTAANNSLYRDGAVVVVASSLGMGTSSAEILPGTQRCQHEPQPPPRNLSSRQLDSIMSQNKHESFSRIKISELLIFSLYLT